ncbi:MAG TPA: thioredoxin-like domain-containing protein [Puia sp.]|nr:thioredoxin-like domain-containing protein [Puia sp.]
MSKILLCLAFSLLVLSARSEDGYTIRLHLKPYTSGKVYLGYYYGKIKALADSAQLNGNSDGIFSGSTRLPGGVYFIVSPNRAILFELLIDSQQHFSVSADTTNLPGSIVFSGSPDNTVFQNYTKYTAEKGKEITADQQALARARKEHDSAAARAEMEKIRQLNDAIQHYREELGKRYPTSLLAMLFRALKEPEIPPASRQPGGRYDSSYAFRYFKDHYWDGISFSDERLTRTPVFEPRLDKYFRDLVSPVPDSIEKEADRMLLESRVSKPMFQYLMVYFVQKYVNPEFMGQDAVFVHLFDKYINAGETEFFTEKYRKYLNDRAYSMMANLIGEPAANLEMVDSTGALRPLYGVKAEYTIVCFWDPTCSHCKEVVPRLDSMYKARWASEGVRIYGVKVDGSREAWLQFIKDHNLSGWTHVYETKEHAEATEKAGQPGFRQLYDVYQTPTLYLLDKDKRIIAKKLSFEQLDEVINLKLQHAKSK